MKAFIFVTHEGYTFQPNSEAIEPDIENLQVLGCALGRNEEQAFENLKLDNPDTSGLIIQRMYVSGTCPRRLP